MQWLARLPRAQAADFTTTSSSRHINVDRTGCFFTSIFPQVSDFSHAMLFLLILKCKSAMVKGIKHDSQYTLARNELLCQFLVGLRIMSDALYIIVDLVMSILRLLMVILSQNKLMSITKLRFIISNF